MRVAIRADASRDIGTGHVMRCLALAGELRDRGGSACFVSQEHDPAVCDLIESSGFPVQRMRVPGAGVEHGPSPFAWGEDAARSSAAISAAGSRPDWLIVDHYAIDHRWETALRPFVGRTLVIDDLANRRHECDLLLDQNYENPRHLLYDRLVPERASLLLGPAYALVRPEFRALRSASLARRDGKIRRILVSMGGTDPGNDTAMALSGVALSMRSRDAIDVVVGQGNPHQAQIRELCGRLPGASLYVQTGRMAELMAGADLAICGGGGTTWERCVLGLPALVAVQSEDQAAIAQSVGLVGGHAVLGWSGDLTPEHYRSRIDMMTPQALMRMSQVSAGICDGAGTGRVADRLHGLVQGRAHA